MTRRAFTLVELLVVITVIVLLMSLIMGGVMLARRAAAKAKTTSAIASLASAVDQYRGVNNIYPEKLRYSSTAGMPALSGINDGQDVYDKIFNDSGPREATAIDASGWEVINQTVVWQLGGLGSELAPNGVVIDAWKTPLRYRPSRWYPFSDGASARIDSANPPNPESFQIWSAGTDMRDEPGNPGEGGDDQPQWAKQQ
jgi:prepilin-type N-terminal cleavage/methylation domain-containing protein